MDKNGKKDNLDLYFLKVSKGTTYALEIVKRQNNEMKKILSEDDVMPNNNVKTLDDLFCEIFK